MSDIRYRLIFNGVATGSDLKRILYYFQKDLGLPYEKIQGLMTSSPRILQEFSNQQAAELAQAALTRIGCLTQLDTAVYYSYLPFSMPQKQEMQIKRELSKVLRCRTSMVILCAQISIGNRPAMQHTMLGSFEEKLTGYFRESDTVIAVDEDNIIVLGFATDKVGVPAIQGKTLRVMKKILGNDVEIKSGYAVFPEEGQTVSKLIYLAVTRRDGSADESRAGQQEEIVQQQETGKTDEGREAISPLQLCFTRARGRIFKRLMNMELQTLWLGLSQIPQEQQRDFLARLPFDSPLTPVLEDYISSQSKACANPMEESHFAAIIQQMELEEGIAERDMLYDRMTSSLSHSEDLPTLPSVATQIYDIASNPESSGTELANLIMKDPALTSKLLKTVNSAFYGNPQKISSVKQAVVLLGTEEIVDLAFGLAAAKVFDTKPIGGLIDPKMLWHHAICTALIAQNLCKSVPAYRDSGVFTAGLLHDVGKIFLIEKFPDIYKKTYSSTAEHDLPLFELEEDHFGMNHATIGRNLSSRWNLPEQLIYAITYHHQPFNASRHSGLAAVTGLADYLYYRATGKEDPSMDIHGDNHWLTVGHWISLTQIFPDMSPQKLDEMTGDAISIIEDNKDYISDTR